MGSPSIYIGCVVLRCVAQSGRGSEVNLDREEIDQIRRTERAALRKKKSQRIRKGRSGSKAFFPFKRIGSRTTNVATNIMALFLEPSLSMAQSVEAKNELHRYSTLDFKGYRSKGHTCAFDASKGQT